MFRAAALLVLLWPAFALAQWNSGDKNAAIVLSNSNYTARDPAPNGYAGVRTASVSRHAGKWYTVFRIDHADNGLSWMVGIGNGGALLNTCVGCSANGIACSPIGGNIYANNFSFASFPPNIADPYIVVAFDLGVANALWCTSLATDKTTLGAWNSGGNPSTGVGGASIFSTNDGVSVMPMFSGNAAGVGAVDQVVTICGFLIADATLAGFSPWGFPGGPCPGPPTPATGKARIWVNE